MKIAWVKKVASDGMHNAFTGLAYLDGKYYLAYRKAAGHVADSARQIIMVSDNGKKWTTMSDSCFSRNIDYRDSYFLDLNDKLFLYSFGTPVLKGVRQKPMVFLQTLNSGENKWSDPQVIHRDSVIWKPIKLNDKFYGAAYFANDGLKSFLYSSDDGIHWKKGSLITKCSSEICFYAPENDRIIAFVRTESPPYYLEVFQSKAPFESWLKINTIPMIIQGAHVFGINGKIYLMGRERPDYLESENREKPSLSQHRTKVWRFEDNDLKEIIELPSSGDCSYPGTAVMPDRSLLASYYSQHETIFNHIWQDKAAADVFVAKMDL
jgi:hypothetical protein